MSYNSEEQTINVNDIVFYDFETGSANPERCQPIQLAAVAIDGRKLEIKERGVFSSFIKPIFDIKECAKYNLDPLEEQALGTNMIKIDDLQKAPSLKLVWENFCQFVNKCNPTKDKWRAPIKAGCNINEFDNHILNRICGGHNRLANEYVKATHEEKIKIKEPWGFGPWDDERHEETLFYPRGSLDIQMMFFWPWTENNQDLSSVSMDAMREWLGIDKTGAHNAKKDCLDGAEVLIRFLKMYRNMAPRINFAGAFLK